MGEPADGSRIGAAPSAGAPPRVARAHERRVSGVARLHEFLHARHCRNGRLVGPDPGIRFNYRVGRFVKSYLRRIPWQDDLYYLQAQGYWTLANWRLFAGSGDGRFREIALRCSDAMLASQRPDGAWEYPNPEWRGRVATGEGVWASIGLLETYRATRDERYLAGVLLWYRFLEDEIGFRPAAGGLAVNYFAGRAGSAVPNNSACTLRFLGDLAVLTREERYLARCAPMISFLRGAQKPTGEFPYALPEARGRSLEHFQCFQYNAFECLDLMRYADVASDAAALELAAGALRFLGAGVGADGRPVYQCDQRNPAVTYHAAVLAAALTGGARRGLVEAADAAARAYAYVGALQRPDGSFPHSHRDYGVLRDTRSYPRYLAMILYHLLERDAVDAEATA